MQIVSKEERICRVVQISLAGGRSGVPIKYTYPGGGGTKVIESLISIAKYVLRMMKKCILSQKFSGFILAALSIALTFRDEADFFCDTKLQLILVPLGLYMIFSRKRIFYREESFSGQGSEEARRDAKGRI
ncbi:MAG: hypothetical protein LBL09_00160 [Oscillospiraceae bacterium]|nr:hypothetical protein [Oscillospiraceae bacterium]